MKQEFLNFLKELMKASPEIVERLMTDNVKAYIDAISDVNNDKPEITDNGKIILDYIQKNPSPTYKAKDIAEGIFLSSRTVSGAMRKLVTDGFLEKMGKEPVLYTITEKGKNYKIEN